MREDALSGYKLLLMGLVCGAALGILIAPFLSLGVPHWEKLDRKLPV